MAKNTKKWLWMTGSTVGAIIIGTSVYAYSLYNSAQTAVNNMYEEPTREVSEKRIDKIEYQEKDPISFLILGVDERENDRGRSDTMVVMTVNPEKKSMQMVSIPRDTRTEIVGKGIQDKINHAYAFGGTDMAVATVENFLDIPIDHYIKVNMESFQEIVNAVGGVKVNNTFAFDYDGVSYPKGEIELNGEEALKYSRMRYDDPNGDFGRQDRQRQIIMGVIEKGASLSSLGKYKDLLAILGENMKTDLTFDQIIEIQANYKEARHNLEQFQVAGTGTKINKIYYLSVPEDERIALSQKLKDHLNLNQVAQATH
ncbi:LytR family transcriptional regulator [Bacillus sp. BGMRC 2118]|nr:LytR family transcriptional regulator [Bacillus sp. BGMRC 2118]